MNIPPQFVVFDSLKNKALSAHVSNANISVDVFKNWNIFAKDYRHITKGIIFKKKWLVQFTIKSQRLNSKVFNNTIKTLTESIKITSK